MLILFSILLIVLLIVGVIVHIVGVNNFFYWDMHEEIKTKSEFFKVLFMPFYSFSYSEGWRELKEWWSKLK